MSDQKTNYATGKGIMPDEVKDASTLWTRLCAIILVLLGFATVTATAVIVVRSYSPYLFWDQWSEIAFWMGLGGQHTIAAFWSQHNEHRIPILRLLCLADLKYFGGTNKSLLIEIFVIQCAHAVLLTWVAKKYGALNGAVVLSLAGFVTYCLFSPLQIEVFYWGFEVTFVLVGLAASACFACAVAYPRIEPAGWVRRNFIVGLSILCCVVAESSLANGLLTWLLLLVLALKLKFARHHVWIIVAASSLGILAYLAGYHSPADNSNPFQTIRQPGRVLSYVVGCLSSSWDNSSVSAITWPNLSQSVTLIAIFLSVGGAIKCLTSRACSRLHLFVFSNLTFTLATIVMNALGRLKYGYAHAATSRYQVMALMFWACIGILLASYAPRYSARTVRWFQAAVIVLLISSVYRWSEMQTFALEHQAAVKTGWVALSRHLMGDPAIHWLFPDANPLRQWFDFIQVNHLGAEPAYPGPARVAQVPNHMRLSGFKYRPLDCDGRLDEVVQITPHSFFLTGWAYDFQDGTRDVKVAVASPKGTAISFTPLHIPRPDVPKVLPKIQAVNTGWALTLNFPVQGDYSVFLIRDRDHSACPIQDLVHVQDVPSPYGKR